MCIKLCKNGKIKNFIPCGVSVDMKPPGDAPGIHVINTLCASNGLGQDYVVTCSVVRSYVEEMIQQFSPLRLFQDIY